MQKIGMQRSSFASSGDLSPLKRVTNYFNSYPNWYAKKLVCKGPPLHLSVILDPSNGSIQFLLTKECLCISSKRCLNPLKRVNSILTILFWYRTCHRGGVSIPSNGSIQFLRFLVWGPIMSLHLVSIPSNGSIQFLLSLSGPFSFGAWGESQSPQTGQFNSYCNPHSFYIELNHVSIPSNGSIQFLQGILKLLY